LLATAAAPLYALTGWNFSWTGDADEAFTNMKRALMHMLDTAEHVPEREANRAGYTGTTRSSNTFRLTEPISKLDLILGLD
jgi:hypothetical protein